MKETLKESIDFIAESGVELAIEVGHYLYLHVLSTSKHIIANLNPFTGNCRADAD